MLLDIVAPWIVEAWAESVSQFAVRLPQIALEPATAHAVVAGAALVSALVAMACVRELPPGARRVARILMLAALTVPAVEVGASRYGAQAEAALERFVLAAREVAQPAGRPLRLPEAAALHEVPAPAAATMNEDMSGVSAGPGNGGQVAVIEAVAPESRVAVTEQPTAAEAAASTIRRLSGFISRKIARRDDPVKVTIFYGTDRAVDASEARITYTAERAGLLTFGRAQVAMPKPSQPGGQLAVTGVTAFTHDELLEAAVAQLAHARAYRDHALVFVHGFNTSFESALYRAAEITRALKFDGAVFLYSWPSAGHIVRYGYDAESADNASPFLADFLNLVIGETGAKSVSIVAYGLGSVPALDALVRLKGKLPQGAGVNDLILAAPDLDRERFGARVRELSVLARRITLYAAASDRALNISRRYVGGVPRAGDVPEGGPMVLAGVETVDVSEPGTEAIGRAGPATVAHSAFLVDLETRIAAGPGADREPAAGLESVASARGRYWRYSSAARVQR